MSARCAPELHKRVWKAEQWICSECLICGCEPNEAKRGAGAAAQYEKLLEQKLARDKQHRGIVLA